MRMSVREVVECGRYGRIGFLGRARESDRRAIAVAMEEAGVARLGNRAIQDLSGGQYQRVQIARALAAEPDLLILDEPVSHLDAEGREGVAALVRSIAREQRISLLLVSHDEDLLALAEPVLAFSSGTVELRDA
jgi:iron complex transport system ATP-binding protein